MKKIIYINYMKQFGHINFDQIQINALSMQGYDVKVVMHQDIAKKMKLHKNMYALILPKILGYECKNSLINRLFFILTLLFIRIRINWKEFDFCIISNLDEITLCIVPLAKKMYLFCHGNCRDLGNKIKLRVLQYLSKKHVFLVFNRDMADTFSNYGFKNVKIISHGCTTAFNSHIGHEASQITKGFNYVAFHPSSKPDAGFLHDIYNKENNEILKEYNVLLLLRNNPFKDYNFSNIKFINKYLETKLYNDLFTISDVIILAYPNSFRHQVSGVSFECVANRKNMLVYKNSSLDYCKDFYNYDIFCKDTTELIQKLTELKLNKDKYKIIVSKDDLTPNYKPILP